LYRVLLCYTTLCLRQVTPRFGTHNHTIILVYLLNTPVQDFIGFQAGQNDIDNPHEKQYKTATPLDEWILASQFSTNKLKYITSSQLSKSLHSNIKYT
jgi:hypothetical protein